MKYSIVIPVYKNEESLEQLVASLGSVASQLQGQLEVVFVIDGSPDQSYVVLPKLLPGAPFHSQLILLSRNFGSFPAVTAGLTAARGESIAVIAADLQEPPELAVEFFRCLDAGDCDVVLGRREARNDPLLTRLLASGFWAIYRRFVQRDMPAGGVDVFACTRAVRDVIVNLPEVNTSLVGLLIWVGFRRRLVGYTRRSRPMGKSAWTFRRKIRYMKDSIFAFSDLPLRLLGLIGVLGMAVSIILGSILLGAKLSGTLAEVPGYAATLVTIVFFGGLNSFGISLLGEYLWRTFENSKGRPRFIVLQRTDFGRDCRESS